MPHGYTVKIDDRDMLEYVKRHDNGEKTRVKADKTGTQATGGTNWLVNVLDPNGSKKLGLFDTKKEARKAMKRWMDDHPKGVQGPGGALGAMDAMEESTESIFRGGGLF